MMQPQCPSTSCDRHPKEQFTGFCPFCLRERLIILGHTSLSSFDRSVASLPPLSLHPHHPSTLCDRHPEEQFIGFCPSCLYERLTILKHNFSSSIHERLATSTVVAIPQTIFQPYTTMHDVNYLPRSSSFSFQLKLRRTMSCPILKNEGLSCTFEPQRKSCDVMPCHTFSSIFNQYYKRKIPIKEPTVEMRNLALSSIVQNRVRENVEKELRIKLEADIEAEKTLKVMEDHMDIDSQAKNTSVRDLKECIWFATSSFKKFQEWRQKQKMKKRE